jgi:hypothetical protein
MQYAYLDQNKWIDLAKAESGKSDGVRFRPTLKMCRELVAKGNVIFPLSAIHIAETAKSPKAEQRKILAGLMTELSQGVVLRSEREMVHSHLERSARQAFGQPIADEPPSAFSRGPEVAFGFDFLEIAGTAPEIRPLLRRFLDSPQGWIDLLSYTNESERKAGIEAVRLIGDNAAMSSEKTRVSFERDDVDLDTFRRTYAARLTLELMQPLTDALKRIGRTFHEWGSLGPDQLMEFWSSIPCLHVELELHSQMHNERSKPWRANDIMDIGSLSIAIPACDVVITERFWKRLAEKSNVAKLYQTRLYSDLEAAIAELYSETNLGAACT